MPRILKAPWTRQPSGLVAPNNAVFAYLPTVGNINLATGERLTVYGSLPVGVSQGGIHAAATGYGNAKSYQTATIADNTISEATLVAIQAINPSAGNVGWHHIQTDAVNTHVLYSGNFYLSTFSSSRWLSAAPPPIGYDRPHTLVIRAKGTERKAWLNKSLVGSGTADANVRWSDWQVGSNDANNYLAARTYALVLFPYALSEKRIMEIADNPWQIFTPANRPIYFDLGAGGAQTLTQSSRFDNANSLSYTHTVSQVGGAQTLTQSTRFDNAPSFFTHTLSSSIALAQSSRFDNANALSYVHTLSQANSPQTLTQSALFDNTPSFFTHSISTGINLSQSSRFDNSNALAYTHTISKSITLDASRFDNDNLFYAHVLTQAGNQTLTQSATETNTNSFYAHAIGFSYSDVGRPSSDVSGTWLASTGTDKFAMVDEVTMDNSDYIYTNTVGAKQRMTLNPMADPGSQGQVFSYSVWSPTGHGITVRLLNRSDDSVIAEWAHPGPLSTTAPATENDATHQTLTPTQIAAIQDSAAIDLEVEATA